MNDAEADSFTKYLTVLSKNLTDDEVEWVAVSIEYKNGVRIALHSREAPLRPKGLSS